MGVVNLPLSGQHCDQAVPASPSAFRKKPSFQYRLRLEVVGYNLCHLLRAHKASLLCCFQFAKVHILFGLAKLFFNRHSEGAVFEL
jgi:hypothetical protein